MTKFVILGSSRFDPYEFLAVPNKIPGAWNTDKGYAIAAKLFYPAMDKADVILVYAPDGIGRHTQMDIDYAHSIGKKVYELKELHKCVDCARYSKPHEEEWPCMWSDCPHHPAVECKFKELN